MQLLSGATKGELAGECAREVFEAVPPMTWFIRRHMGKHRAGLSLPQCRVLCLLDVQPDASLSTIADFLGASLPTASRMVSGLVEEGWVSRCGSTDDRRQVLLGLTARGKKVMSDARRATTKELEVVLGRLSGEEQAKAIEGLRVLRGVFGSLSDVSQTEAMKLARGTGAGTGGRRAAVET